MCFNFFFFIFSFSLFFVFAAPAPSFGKFEIIIDNLEMCKGPKRKDCTIWDMKVDNKRILVYNLTITQNVAPLKVKVVISSNGKELVRLQMARVCENVFMKPLFTSMFNATKQCVIPKGYFHHELDMQEIFQQYYGGEFLLGKAVFRSVINNDDCNFSCSVINVTFAPNGKFTLRLISADRCKGPKRVDCCSMDWYIVNEKILHVNMNATQNVAPLRAKIVVGTNGNNMIRLQTNKVCDHVFLKPFMKTILNVTDDCSIMKGNYKFMIDTENIVQKYYGGEFFYGNVSIHSILNNNQCNFSCSILKLILSPKS
nr:uncharacterized protein LOC128676519 [Plodia interpunctella]